MYSDQELSEDLSEQGTEDKMQYFMSIPEFVSAVKAGTCKPAANLVLHNPPGEYEFVENSKPVTVKDLEVLVDTLLSENCPRGLRLFFGSLFLFPVNVNFNFDRELDDIYSEYAALAYPLDIQGLEVILRLLEAGDLAPEAMHITLTLKGEMGPTGAKLIANSLAKGLGPRQLSLQMFRTPIGLTEINAFAEGLDSGRYPDGFALRLDQDSFPKGGVTPADELSAYRALALTLGKGHCPKGLGLDFCINHPEVVTALVEALSNGNCPIGLTLYLHANSRKPYDDLLKGLFERGVGPLGLRLKFFWSNISETSFKLLEEIHATKRCIPGLSIRSFTYTSEAEEIEELAGDDIPQRTQLLLKKNDAWYVEEAKPLLKACMLVKLVWQFSGEDANPISKLPLEVLNQVINHVLPAWWRHAVPGHFNSTGRISFFRHVERIASSIDQVKVVSDEDDYYSSDAESATLRFGGW